jgi:hypothetical protein
MAVMPPFRVTHTKGGSKGVNCSRRTRTDHPSFCCYQSTHWLGAPGEGGGSPPPTAHRPPVAPWSCCQNLFWAGFTWPQGESDGPVHSSSRRSQYCLRTKAETALPGIDQDESHRCSLRGSWTPTPCADARGGGGVRPWSACKKQLVDMQMHIRCLVTNGMGSNAHSRTAPPRDLTLSLSALALPFGLWPLSWRPPPCRSMCCGLRSGLVQQLVLMPNN